MRNDRVPSPNSRLFIAALVIVLLALWSQWALAALGNGKLQIHHIDVKQGDGILIISPQGQLALIDDGTYTDCALFVNYITGLGITNFDYHFASHYHADHIGCYGNLIAAGVVLNIAGYDRGYSYSSASYTNYVNGLGAKRVTMTKNQTITLDAGSANPVTIKCVDLNGAGVYSPTGSDENSKSMVLKVTYGSFDEVLGGDLTSGSGNDVETTVGPEVGDVEVYKVHHHASATSTNDSWLTATTPEVGIISVGNGNSYGHPTSAALTRLHNHNVKTYWTETGAGVAPLAGWDKVGGTIIVEADAGAGAAYTVRGNGFTDTYYNGAGGGGGVATKTYVPTSATALIGTISSGTYANLASDNSSYMVVTSAKSGTRYYTDWYGSTTIAETPTKLTITYNGKYSTSRTQTLYLYNFSTSAWTQINQGTVGTSDVTRTYVTTTPASFISAGNEIRVRVAANNRTSSYTCSGDYLAYTIEYPAATIASLSSGKDKWNASETPASSEPDIAVMSQNPLTREIEAWPNPSNPNVSVGFELARPMDGEVCVYDVSGRKVAVLASGTLERGSHVFVWSGNGLNGERVSSGVYIARLEGEGVTSSAKLIIAR